MLSARAINNTTGNTAANNNRLNPMEHFCRFPFMEYQHWIKALKIVGGGGLCGTPSLGTSIMCLFFLNG